MLYHIYVILTTALQSCYWKINLCRELQNASRDTTHHLQKMSSLSWFDRPQPQVQALNFVVPTHRWKAKHLQDAPLSFFYAFFFPFFSFSNLPDTAFFLQSLRGVFYCMLKDKICIESSNFIWVKIIYKNPKTYFMKLVQTIFPAVGFCSKDHSWEILYKIKIGLDSEKYSTVLISNWEYLHKYLQWKKCYFKTLICKLTSSTL